MPVLAILTPKEQKIFDNPPNFNPEARSKLFKLTSYEHELVQAVYKPTNKICFVLQLIYFKHSARLFNPKQFNSKDIEQAAKILNLPIADIKIAEYQRATFINHQSKILEYSGWQKLNNTTEKVLKLEIESHASQQRQPKDILYLIEHFLINNKIVVPNYYLILIRFVTHNAKPPVHIVAQI